MLMECGFYGYIDIVKLLVKNGADLNARDKNQKTKKIKVFFIR